MARTLEMTAVVIGRLYSWASEHDIDLEARILKGHWLTPPEMESLTGALLTIIPKNSSSKIVPLVTKPRPKSSDMAMLRESPEVIEQVSSEVGSWRVKTVAAYIKWLSNRFLKSLSGTAKELCRKDRDEMIEDISNAQKAGLHRNSLYGRQGPGQKIIDQLLTVVDPLNGGNPWKKEPLHLRIRNQLMVHMLYHLGLRRGELLTLRIASFNPWGEGQLFVERVPDDPNDPRGRYAPQVKTLDRDLPMNSGLVRMLLDYINDVRVQFPAAENHDYIFVSHSGKTTGKPLSEDSVNKTFQAIKRRVPNIKGNISAHILRHAHHDKLAALGKEEGYKAEDMTPIHQVDGGWRSPATAETYKKRHTKEEADVLRLKLQRQTMQGSRSVPRGESNDE